MSQERGEGVVLRTYPLGEADRIVILVTREHGKLRAVAKGARKSGSRFGARLEPGSYVQVMVWRGRGALATVTSAEVVERFLTVRGDLDRLAGALTMLEAVDGVAQEDHSDDRLVETLVRALRVLDDGGRDPTLVAPAFLLRLLEIEGAQPVTEHCASCGEEGPIVAFDMVEGGVLCASCRSGRAISPEALLLLRRVLGGDLAGVLSGPPPEGAAELTSLASDAMEAHLDRRLRATRFRTGL